jgi:glycosyltransferase involved in cell wall biosynthesis
MPRVLIVDNRELYLVSHRLPILTAARDKKFDVHATTLTGDDLSALDDVGLPSHPVAPDRPPRSILGDTQLLWRLRRLIGSLEPDFVHCVTLRSILYVSFIAVFGLRRSLIHHVTGLGYLFSERTLRRRIGQRVFLTLLRILHWQGSHFYIFQNHDDLAVFQQAGLAPAAKTCVVKGSGVDLPETALEVEQDEVPLVVFPARMLWEKGVGEFVAAAERARESGRSARFALVGDWDPENPGSVPREKLEQRDRQGVVEWWGYRTDMWSVLGRAHVVCLPSRYGEGIPKVLIEAAAVGRPIVTTDMPGCRDIVTEGVNGHLVPAGDPARLSQALEKLLEDEATRTRMGAEARRIVQDGFSVEEVVGQVLEMYDRAAEASRR